MAQEDSEDQVPADYSRARFRDFVILTTGGICLLLLLLMTNAIGFVEWITASIVLIAGALAYYVGSQPTLRARPASDKAKKTTRAEDGAPTAQSIGLILMSLPLPGLLIGAEGRITHTNLRAREVFRLNSAVEPLASAAIRHPALLDAVERVARTASGERLQFSLRDDAESWLAHMQAGPAQNSVIIVLEDQTAVSRAERARADFLANASHELRTPLTAIGGFIETMRGPAKDDPEAWDGFLTIMEQQTDRMKRLVADLLSLSRIEFAEHLAPSTQIDLRTILQNSEASLSQVARQAGITYRLDIADEALPIIADVDEMTQVVQNLASNAIKYSPPGGIVTVTVGRSDTMANAALMAGRRMSDAKRALLLSPRAADTVPATWIRVEDQGAGIPPQHLPRLGERFYRADESRGGKIDGTGLGLAIVKHIMARHRGGLAVESLENKGSAFAIWMPLMIAANLE